MDGTNEQLQLIFHGPKDESVETLRKVKGAFISELGLSIDEVKQYLESTPTIIFSTKEAEEAQRVLHILEHAGAVVAFEEENTECTPHEVQNDIEFTFELDDISEDTTLIPGESVPAKPTRVYTLDFNPDIEDQSDESHPLLGLEAEHTEETDDVILETNQLGFTDETLANDSLREPLTPQTESETNEPISPLSFDISSESDEEQPAPPLESDEWQLEESMSLSFEAEEPTQQEEDRESTSEREQSRNIGESWDLSFESEEEPTVEENPEEQLAHDTSSKGTSPTSGQIVSDSEEMKRVVFNLEEKEEPLNIIQEVPHTDTPVVESATSDSIPTDTSSISEVLHPEVEGDEEELPLGSLGNDPLLASLKSADNQTSAKALRRNIFLTGIGIGIVLCLMAFNAFLFWDRQTSEPEVPAFVENALRDEKVQPLLRESLESSARQPLETELIKGSAKTAFGTIWFEFNAFDNQLESGEFSFAAKQPKSRTKEEVARGISPRPWLHNTEFTISSFSSRENGELVSEGPVKLFVQQGTERFRELGHLSVVVNYESATGTIQGTMFLSKNKQQDFSDQELFVFSGTRSSGFSLLAKIPFSTTVAR